jgi:hypothetical protein
MNLNFRTVCSAAVLCFAGNVFAMDFDSLKDSSSNSGSFSQLRSIEQASSKDLSREGLLQQNAILLKMVSSIQKQNERLQHQVEMYEDTLNQVLKEFFSSSQDKTNETEELRISNQAKTDEVVVPEPYIVLNKLSSDTAMSTGQEILFASRDENKRIEATMQGVQTPMQKLNEYLDKSTEYEPSGVTFKYDVNAEGKFSCKIKLRNKSGEVKVFDTGVYHKSKKDAKLRITEYVYDCLVNKTSAR